MTTAECLAILGLKPGAGLDEIQKAYRTQAKLHHPDVGGDAERFKQIHDAYQTLTNPSYRLRNGSRMRNQNVDIPIAVDLEHLIFGLEMTTFVSTWVSEPNVDPHTRIGDGKTNVVALLDKIPKGGIRPVRFNHKLSCGEMGIIQATTHYQPKPHARYKIAQDQLLVDQQIDLKQALKGGKVLIETLFGLRNLKIPPGTMAGDILQIKKHGHLKPLLVRISQIRMPSKDELKTEKWKELGIDWAQATTEEDEEA